MGGTALFFLIRTSGRSMKVNAEGYTAPGGKVIPFESIFKIDKRKWKGKGIAWVFYKDANGEEKKAKVDGMVYGQFDDDDPHNAEVLYQRIEASVIGVELIDFEEDEDESEASEEESSNKEGNSE